MLKPYERIDELFRENMRIIQSSETFSFSVDALLLANFVKINKRDNRIMDLCSGNGIIPLLLSSRAAKPIDAVEIQSLLADMAERSIEMNGKSDQITIYNADIKSLKTSMKHSSYDVITVNPPYFTSNQPLKDKGPQSIARHELHIDLKGIVEACRYLITNKGRLYMVHRAERSAEVFTELHNQGFRVRRAQYVYNDTNSRTAMFIVVEAIFNSNAYADILPPFYIYKADQVYSDEMLEVYYGDNRG
ncbi:MULTISPECIES: tRNA1(Val) (adenine(37)-N6)-methyltransferase [Jeotgalicoccus]|uniref:tRNA1(Val) (Adenine(37)-N6)-methyltransferase n=1 Tax=Jeotgalicoccus nanhaiensis TaxID=568603 RepID=A0ABR9Y0L6_9STAP|nr:tRNA1(Val) (adenine(37)-N6)-methyltransferase [Jeotgalicoccus nanhaiensis]MBF0754652.1 tRNA1(Val) (adenine(37)-N6)-methyltransferase [Jeotgalicoccus nanhaiensis]TFU60997.1 tRNA1(Val) (adenine(37)-N6)-methyltransferase [Jeotgalicoccus nanhaiensis]